MTYSFNKSTLAVLLAATLGIPAAQAADGTINFTGTITDSACTVSTASATQTVALGTVSSTALSTSGDVAAATMFTIDLTGCPATVTSARVSFGGPVHASNPSILALTAASVATNVGVALYENNGITSIPLNTPSASTAISGTTATLTFIAKYMATGTATAGTANATTEFTVIYP